MGSQTTEACLLVPYWKTLPSTVFYSYYAEIGPIINRFCTLLTVLAVLVTLAVSIYFKLTQPRAFWPSVVSSISMLPSISAFYLYFKEANQQFYQATLNPPQLQAALVTWELWHWLRVHFESLPLLLLILAFYRSDQQES